MDFILDPSLALYLPLHERDGASFISRDAYGHPVTRTGALWTPRGYVFDGIDDWLELPDVPALAVTGDLTLEAWLKWDSTQGDVDGSILHRNRPYIFRVLNTGGITFFYHDGTAWRGLTSTGTIGDTRAYHLAVTRRTVAGSSLVKIYIDAVEDASSTLTGTAATMAQTLRIGAYDGASERVKGAIGEIRIYNRFLTLLEIQQNYLATKWRYR